MLHHVQLAAPAGSEDQLRAFYTGVLGWRELPKPPILAARGGCWFQVPGHGGPDAELHVGIEEDFRPARKAHPAFACVDPDALAASLETSGAPVDWNGDVSGVRRFYTSDPFGNRLEIVGVPLRSAF